MQARILETTQQVVAPDNLKSMVIYQATGLGIKTDVGPEGYRFEPELLGDLPGAEEDEGPQRSSLLNRSETTASTRGSRGRRATGTSIPSRATFSRRTHTSCSTLASARRSGSSGGSIGQTGRRGRRSSTIRCRFCCPRLRQAGSDGSVVEFSDRVIGVVSVGTRLQARRERQR